MNGFSKEMANFIRGWGFPEILQKCKEDIVFKFNDEGLTMVTEDGYHCRDRDVKFCLYNKKTKKVLFSIDFFIPGNALSKLSKKKMIIELLYVHDEKLRKKGISTYYLCKLQKYAIHEKVEFIQINANANAKNFKNDSKNDALSQKRLESFYNKMDTIEMPIILI